MSLSLGGVDSPFTTTIRPLNYGEVNNFRRLTIGGVLGIVEPLTEQLSVGDRVGPLGRWGGFKFGPAPPDTLDRGR